LLKYRLHSIERVNFIAPYRQTSKMASLHWLNTVVALAITLPVIATPILQETRLSSRAPSNNKSVIIQLFEWDWDSVATECKNFIGPAGYGFVQGMRLV
jgi:hypothetical protein